LALGFCKARGRQSIPSRPDGPVEIDHAKKVVDMWPEFERLVGLELIKHLGVSNLTLGLLEKLQFDPRVHIQPFVN
jgi:diketogulonate reductase-like aldo/keto reductase